MFRPPRRRPEEPARSYPEAAGMAPSSASCSPMSCGTVRLATCWMLNASASAADDQLGPGDRRQAHKLNPGGELVCNCGGDRHRQAGFPGASWPGETQQANVASQQQLAGCRYLCSRPIREVRGTGRSWRFPEAFGTAGVTPALPRRKNQRRRFRLRLACVTVGGEQVSAPRHGLQQLLGADHPVRGAARRCTAPANRR